MLLLMMMMLTFQAYWLSNALHRLSIAALDNIQDATLSQGVPRDAAVNFGTPTYRSFEWHLRTRNSADSEIEDPHRTP